MQRNSRKVGLARALSKLGYCSRSRAAELIRAGRVSLNGRIRRDPETPVVQGSQIGVDGDPVKPEQKIYLMLNKPRGVVTTASDEKGRDTVYTTLGGNTTAGGKSIFGTAPWLAPVGRLDKASEGLLLLTNDSEWASRVADPKTHLEKTYHVQISTTADDEFTGVLSRGITAKDGTRLRAKRVSQLRGGDKNCWLEIVLDEGKNRQIRRMMEALDVDVLRLVRVAVGPLKLGELAKGEHREITAAEKRMLDGAMMGRNG